MTLIMKTRSTILLIGAIALFASVCQAETNVTSYSADQEMVLVDSLDLSYDFEEAYLFKRHDLGFITSVNGVTVRTVYIETDPKSLKAELRYRAGINNERTATANLTLDLKPTIRYLQEA